MLRAPCGIFRAAILGSSSSVEAQPAISSAVTTADKKSVLLINKRRCWSCWRVLPRLSGPSYMMMHLAQQPASDSPSDTSILPEGPLKPPLAPLPVE